jgi:hypothetical protein
MSGEWIPRATSGAWKKWRSTSGGKTSGVRDTNPLEELRNIGLELLKDPSHTELSIHYEGPPPADKDFLVLLGMYVLVDVRGEAEGPYQLLIDWAPAMKEERKDAWSELYYRMNVTRKAEVA